MKRASTPSRAFPPPALPGEKPRSSRAGFFLNLFQARKTYSLAGGYFGPSFEQRPVASIFRYARRCFHLTATDYQAAYRLIETFGR